MKVAKNKWSLRVTFPDGMRYSAESSLENPTPEQMAEGIATALEQLNAFIKSREPQIVS